MKLKKFLASIAISTLAVLGVAAQSSKAVESSIVAVTVYTDRALVTRRAEFVLPAGESTLVFSGLPSSTDPSSVQVKGAGAFSLRDVRVASRQLARDVSAQLKALEDEKRAVEDRLYAVNDRIKEAEAERQFLADMAKRLTGNAGDSETLPLDTAAWARMLDFYRTRNEAVNERIRTARREAQATQAELDRVNREIKALEIGRAHV